MFQIPTSPATVNAVTGTISEQGRLFSGAGIDGLVLWALILGTSMMFAALVTVLVLASRSAARSSADANARAQGYADAGRLQADALKELATAFASSHSADMAFKQAMFALYPDLEKLVREIEERRAAQPQP
jgi:hypothetical protein